MLQTATLTSPGALTNTSSSWLTRYYAVRASVSLLWVGLAFTIGRTQPSIGMILLVAYPAWDCLANVADAARTGGLRANPSQALNAVVSALVTAAVAVTVSYDKHVTLGAIGLWAALSGVLQLSTGLRRWRETRAQWPQILSGAQSCLAAVHFVSKATNASAAISVADVAPYAAFGAFYFAVSAVMLLRKHRNLLGKE